MATITEGEGLTDTILNPDCTFFTLSNALPYRWCIFLGKQFLYLLQQIYGSFYCNKVQK